MPENYYRILGLSNSATEEEIKTAYRKLAKKYHPDRHGGSKDFEEIFKRVRMAYEVLSDPVKKSHFDQQTDYERFQTTFSSSVPPVSQPARKKKEYTPMAWMYGKIFILSLILVCLLIPYLIFHYSSVFRYEAGLEYESQERYVDAVNAYREAISFWGGRNLEACFRAGILLSEHGAPREAVSFFTQGLNYTAIDSVEASLHWYASKALTKSERFKQAIDEIELAALSGFPEDSVQRFSGEIYAYYLREYSEAEKHFNYMIDHDIHLDEAWFGKAWSKHNLFLYDEAIEAYTQSLKYNPNQQLAIYNRGISYYYSNDSIQACTDFLKGIQLGHGLAEATFNQYCRDSIKSFLPPTENRD